MGVGTEGIKTVERYAAVLLDDEARNQCFLQLHQDGLKAGRLRMTGEPRSQTAKHRVTGNLFEDSPLRGVLRLCTDSRLNQSPDKKAQPYEYQDRNNTRVGNAVRQMRADRLDQNL